MKVLGVVGLVVAVVGWFSAFFGASYVVCMPLFAGGAVLMLGSILGAALQDMRAHDLAAVKAKIASLERELFEDED